jgi:curli biogenesis system outer membrane secretion channel CsgG
MLTLLNTRNLASLAVLLVVLPLASRPSPSLAQSDASAVDAEVKLVAYPIAILPFRARGKEVENMGGQVADLIFAKLVVDPGLFLVEREDLDKVLTEAELNLSGIVNPKEAIAIGQLTGARLIVTGSVFQVENKVYCVAKIIGTETSRAVGASVNEVAGSGLDGISNRLGEEIIRSIRKSSDSLVARPVKKSDRIAALNAELGDAQRPTVFISVEERHVGQPTIDPAAETELMLFCKETGFEVIDPNQGSSQQAKYLIQGEGMSEFAGRRGNLASVKARLEIKVVDRATGNVIAADRQTRVAVDLVEQIAGKQALQEAAADIAERLLPKLVNAGGAQQ